MGNYCLAHSITAEQRSVHSKQRHTEKLKREASGELQQQGLPQFPPWPCGQQLLSDVAPPCRSCSCAGTAVEETTKGFSILSHKLILVLKITQHNEMEVFSRDRKASLRIRHFFCSKKSEVYPFEAKHNSE